MIRFLIDAQLPPGLARHLVERGHTAEHVSGVNLRTATDNEIWQYAKRTGATLITKDEDFVAFASQNADGPQVVWIRIGNITNKALWQVIDPILDQIVAALNTGERIVEIL